MAHDDGSVLFEEEEEDEGGNAFEYEYEHEHEHMANAHNINTTAVDYSYKAKYNDALHPTALNYDRTAFHVRWSAQVGHKQDTFLVTEQPAPSNVS